MIMPALMFYLIRRYGSPGPIVPVVPDRCLLYRMNSRNLSYPSPIRIRSALPCPSMFYPRKWCLNIDPLSPAINYPVYDKVMFRYFYKSFSVASNTDQTICTIWMNNIVNQVLK